MPMHRLAAFADGAVGGNPAGVHLSPVLPDAATMQRVAAEVGYSETVFAAPLDDGRWRVRYFAPASEVPFCGHATIALGAVLARDHGEGRVDLVLNDAAISVEGRRDGDGFAATLTSPPTRSAPLSADAEHAALALFGWRRDVLDPRLPPARIHAGADHYVFALRTRGLLAQMRYDLRDGQRLMRDSGLITIAFVYAGADRRFDARNAFASGGVLEDPATGAAAAAFAGYLRDRRWPHGGGIEIVQGEDMGMRSRLQVAIDETPGSPVRVSGRVRDLDPHGD